MVTIDETEGAHSVDMESIEGVDGWLLSIEQGEDWIQIDEKQAAKLIEILQKFIDGEEV